MLTKEEIDLLQPSDRPYRVLDANNLLIEVRPVNTKYWRLRYRFRGKPNMLSLGRYPDVSPEEARAAREVALEVLSRGRNPSKVKGSRSDGVRIKKPIPKKRPARASA